MMGCTKFVEMDALLRRVKASERPFGGLDILLVGDFAQLPPVMATSIMSALVQSTHDYSIPDKDILIASSLARHFVKFDLFSFQRSKGCLKLKQLLLRYRSSRTNDPSITMEEIRDIGVLDKTTLTNDPAFRDATVLVSTRRERESLTESMGQLWTKERGIPVYWWY